MRSKEKNKIIIPIIASLTFLFFVLLFSPFQEQLDRRSDEGMNLMRAMLVEFGYPLYDQVLSDQPPLLTYFLASIMRAKYLNPNYFRMTILLFSTILVWSCTQWTHLQFLLLHFSLIGLNYYWHQK